MLGTVSRPQSWRPADGAAPLFATPRNPDRRSEGAQVAVVAESLGTPLIPWQRYVADVAGERRENGEYEHQIVVVSVPRQTGKTTLIRAEGVHTCLVCRRDFFYTAQTGKDARERWMDLVTVLRTHEALGPRVQVGLRGGSEQVTFPGGARFRAFAPTVESLHGYTPPKVCIDEAFAQTGISGDLLMGAIGPAQFTITDRQLWIVSTAGTAESTFLHDWIDRGLEGTPRVALFLWGAAEHHDPFNLDHIAQFHPGVGHVLNGKRLTAADVLAQADMTSRAEYERAFANRRTLTSSHLIPSESWAALSVDQLIEPPGTGSGLRLAFDVAGTRESAAIVAGWRTPAGVPAVKIVRAQAGYGWLPEAVRDLAAQLRPLEILGPGSGPGVEVSQQLTDLPGFHALSEREFAAASGAFLRLIDEAGLVHDGDDYLARSVVGLVPRTSGGDGLAISRRHSVGDSSPGVAAAVVAARTATEPEQVRPVIYIREGR